MNKLKLAIASLLVFVTINIVDAQEHSLAIIPQPNQVTLKPGTFKLSPSALSYITGFKNRPVTIDKFARQVISQVKKGNTADKNQKVTLTLQTSAAIIQDG